MSNDKSDLRRTQKSAKSLFFSGVLVLTIANLLVKVVGLASKIALNRVVGSIGAGYYSSAYEIYAYLYVLSTAGLPVAISIMVSKSRSKGRLLETKKIFDIAIIMFVLIGFVFSLAMIIFSKQLADFIGAPETSISIVAIAPTMLFICLSSCMRGYFQGFQLMAPTAISQFIEAASKVLIGIGLALWAKSKGYGDHIVASYTILGVTIGVFLGMIFLFLRKAFFKEQMLSLNEISVSEEKRGAKELIKQMLKISIPITLSSSVLSLTTILDTLMVQNRLLVFGMNPTTVRIFYGDYTSLVISMFNLPTIFIYPIANALVPLITTSHERGEYKREESLRSFGMRLTVVIALPCALGLGTFAKPILDLLMFKESSVNRAAPWLSIASASVLFLGIIAITNSFLNSVGKQKLPIISMIAGATVKLVSNYFLLARIGIYGAPVSTVLCYVVASGLNIYFVSRYVGRLPKIKELFIKPLLCSALSISLSALIYYFFNELISSKPAIILAILASVMLYLILALKTGTVLEEELSMLPRSENLRRILKKLKILPQNGENI